MTTPLRFNGPDYSAELDGSRLTDQHIRIREFMRTAGWKTLAEIEAATGDPPASISAQLRHLRKERFGSWVVEKRRRGEGKAGCFEYQLLPPGSASATQRALSVTEQLARVRRELVLTKEALTRANAELEKLKPYAPPQVQSFYGGGR